MKSFQAQTFYELLEVSVGAGDSDIRAAFERLARLYAEDQVALYGLIDDGRARALRTRLKEAVETLLDAERRATYDAGIGLPPRDVPKAVAPKKAAAVAPVAWAGSYAFVSASTVVTAPVASSFTYTMSAPIVTAPRASAPVVQPQPVVAIPAPPEPVAPLASPTASVAVPPSTLRPEGRVEGSVVAQVPEVRAEPVPAVRAEPVAEVRSEPVPEVRSEPVPAVRAEPVPEVRAEPAPEVRAEPAPEVRAEPAPEVRVEPAPVVRAEQVPEVRAEPVPEVRAEPVPVVRAEPFAAPAELIGASAPQASVAPVTPVSAQPPEFAVAATNDVVNSAPAEAAVAPQVAAPPAATEPTAPPREPVVVSEPAAPAVVARPVEVASLRPVETEEARVAPGGDDEGSSSAIVPTRPYATREYRPPERSRPYEVPAGVEFNGDLLRQVRMARGLSLLQVAERTRIGVRHLENVENDRYEQLPVAVYLRGMLMSLARELGLDGLRVSKSYLTFVEAHLAKSKG